MQGHYRNGMQQRDEEDYEREDYDEYEEEASEPEKDDEKEEPMPSKEQQDFLKLREQLKEKFRQKLKKQSASAFGHSSQSQKKLTTTNDKFGSFFGPSQPVIASRVIDESRSIRETQHIMSRVPCSSSGKIRSPASTSTEKKTHVVHHKQPKVVNEVKKKAQTLKDMRDYSFLLSDDADFPTPAKEQQAVLRKVSVPSSDRSAQALPKSKIPRSKPARLASNGHELNSASKNVHALTKLGPVKGAPGIRPKPASTVPRKVGGSSAGNGPGQAVGHKALLPKVPAHAMGTNKPPAKVTSDPCLKKKPSSAAIPHSFHQNLYSEQKRPTQGLDKTRTVPKQPLPKPQPSKQTPPCDIHKDLIKKPVRRRFDEDDDEDAIQMIRNMFGYNPNRYAGVDEDDSDMEADFNEIQKEERRSLKIAKKEDEEQLRLIEEEERRERLRKKQKLSRQ